MKSNFFLDLLDSGSNISSKRFAGLFLILIFGVTAIISALGVDIKEQAVDLCKNAGWLGGALLGINGLSQIVEQGKAKTKTEDEIK